MSKANVHPPTATTAQTDIDISVVVPFYNAEKYIEACAKALLEQSHPVPHYEIIMTDNNSTDGSAALVRKYPQIQLLCEEEQGSYAARNRGVAAARGTIIAFTDADCVPSPDWLQKLTAPMCASKVGIVQGGRVYARDSLALSMLAAYEAERATYTFSGMSGGLYYGYTNNMAVRREIFDQCGPFLEILRGADSIFVNTVIEATSGEIVRYAPDARIRHLEITSVGQYLRKKFIHGRSLQQNYPHRKKSHRNVTFGESFAIVKNTIRCKRYSLLQSLYLSALIVMGMVCFSCGRLSVRWTGGWR